ncbi:gephyrin-like molybdotransferase Glp [Demequina sp. NBRC 110057]|uniref:molybdopterin molybdotransferase MoeA n=1 Tax=Demequina sp. NBRC 110057 TaxID=1570346 RepID=UPI0013565464|nr:gephyrin-like molybdotransferase Glp [Demequina sp. NBRC 110057]
MTTRSLADHHAAVAQALVPNPAMDVLIADAVGGTLAQDIVARHDVPVHPVASCDGYAVAAADVASARVGAPAVVPVSHDIDFSARSPRTHIPGTAARIPSGAAIPRGADAVVALAATDGGMARVAIEAPVAPGEGVTAAGSEVAAGTLLASAGSRLGPRQVAAAAALGMPRLRVHPVPRVVVLAVGDEIIDPGARQRGSEVPDANSHLLAGMIRRAGAQAFRVGPVPDEPRALRAAIEDQLVRADVLITTGGLSDGPRDTVAAVLAQLGSIEVVDLDLAPGGRQGLGSIEFGDRLLPVVALPGHPGAAAVGFEACVRPALRAMCGYTTRERDTVVARAGASWSVPAGVVRPTPVTLEDVDGVPVATPLPSGRLGITDLAHADALVWCGTQGLDIAEGDPVRCSYWG